MLDSLYDNIGGKIKNWAKWIFIVEAIGAIITGLVLMFAYDDFILYGFLALVCGPIVAWVGSWVLYAFGELVEKTRDNESNTRMIVKLLKENKQDQKNKNNDQENKNNDQENKNNDQENKNNDQEVNSNNLKVVNRCIIENEILKKYNGNDTHIIIPENITAIGNQAFFKINSVISITIPNGVTTVCEWAVYNCKNLEKIIISDSVTDIGKNSFYGCEKLTIYAPTGSYAEQYAKENNIPFVTE